MPDVLVVRLLLLLFYFFNVGPPKEDIFSDHLLWSIFQSMVHIYFTDYISIVGLWGQLSCTASTPLYSDMLLALHITHVCRPIYTAGLYLLFIQRFNLMYKIAVPSGIRSTVCLAHSTWIWVTNKHTKPPRLVVRLSLLVVYFGQQSHACACVRMVINDRKRFKIIKNILFSSCAWEAHVRLMQKHEEK